MKIAAHFPRDPSLSEGMIQLNSRSKVCFALGFHDSDRVLGAHSGHLPIEAKFKKRLEKYSIWIV